MNSRAVVLVALAPMLCQCAALCQEKPPVDRTDPVAVVNAYLAACNAGDVTTAVSLLAPDDPLRELLPKVIKNMSRGMEQQQVTFSAVLSEFLFLPVGLSAQSAAAPAEATDQPGTVAVKRTLPLDQKFILHQDQNGLWSIDLVASIKATTGLGRSFMIDQQAQGGPAGDRPWECENNLRTLVQAIVDYADEHQGFLPDPNTWMDELLPYVLDRNVFKCPAAPDLECGYAFNRDVAGMALPEDWGQRRELVLLFEWGSGERNANASAAQMGAFHPRHGSDVYFVTADLMTHTALQGETPDQVFAEQQLTDACAQHMRLLCQAIRSYAKDHGGVLPGADTWCDDIAPYLTQVPQGESPFACPAAPGLECAYVINSDVAGKNASDLVGHRSIVLLMESDAGARNASATPDTPAPRSRHRTQWSRPASRGSNFGYLSGDVMFAADGQAPIMR